MTTYRPSDRSTGWMALAAVASLLVASGCVGPADVVMYEPGVYKGSDDPLLAKLAEPEQIQKLENRFEQGQTDR